MSLHDSHSIVVEHGRHIFRRKLVSGVRDKQTGFANSTIPNHNTSVVKIESALILSNGKNKEQALGQVRE